MSESLVGVSNIGDQDPHASSPYSYRQVLGVSNMLLVFFQPRRGIHKFIHALFGSANYVII